MVKPPDEDLDRRRNHDEDLKLPKKAGEPPRPATEPAGAEGSSSSSRTATDPATGEVNKRAGRKPRK
jgi:hypothetical protein